MGILSDRIKAKAYVTLGKLQTSHHSTHYMIPMRNTLIRYFSVISVRKINNVTYPLLKASRFSEKKNQNLQIQFGHFDANTNKYNHKRS